MITRRAIKGQRAGAFNGREGEDTRQGPEVAGGTPSGLSSQEAAARLRRNGANVLPQAKRARWLGTLGNILREPMLLLLLVAAAIYWLLGDPQEAAVLGVSILLVIAVTAYQELKSEHALQALRDLSSPRARVVRDGTARWVAARELVTGDVILLAEGDRVPADARIFGDSDLQVDESMLTGESVPVRHRSGAAMTKEDNDLLGASTLVVAGQGRAEVIATGAHTSVGRIGAALRSIPSEPSPMQREMRRVVATLALIGLASCALVVVLYASTRGNWLEALLAGITLAISNVPEELPVVMTVFLALGAWRMARHQALIRRAPAIEALGAITVLCTDKTGTLTENQMAVTELTDGSDTAPPGAELPTALRRVLDCADLAAQDRSTDPMEQAIRTAARDGQGTGGPRREHVREYPLSDALLAKVEVWRGPGLSSLEIAGKGAPEAIADLCVLEPATRARILAKVDAMARRGLRVLAVAEATWPDIEKPLPASARGFNFSWRGLVGLADPLRDGVPEAIAEARAAGVRVVMLTGDHLQTACAIAAAAGLSTRVTALGSELDTLSDDELNQRAADIDVFARVRPEHKLRLVRALKQAGDVVAMTGDGVNDAPALMAAHVGIAMGGRGTDVAREAASIVLLDDNFVTVVKAIERGRTIRDNIHRAVRFILAVHVPITGLALLPLLTGAPLVLLPVHVVFLEMIIDPSCSIVFEREPPEASVMHRPPHPPNQHLLDLATLLSGLAEGIVVLAAVVGIYVLGRHIGLPQAQLASMSFTALVTGNLGLILLNRSATSMLRALQRPNVAFWLVASAALGLLIAAIWLDTPARWFHFAPIPAGLMAIALLLPLLSLLGFDLLRSSFPLFRRGTSSDPC